ncbi:hypothetical protein L5515_019228 [Caenorhabditis briggsae]|uniref:Uncharacterized protein n=1 Tax=Caenorhabditis briggsae TaxID=6238 RepID=A0AAE9JTF8_CAEBR|nr:hypothetical protein L5515_019228 [Caenorhabditis briggsae]
MLQEHCLELNVQLRAFFVSPMVFLELLRLHIIIQLSPRRRRRPARTVRWSITTVGHAMEDSFDETHWEYKWFECGKGPECQFLGQTRGEMKDHWMLRWIGKMVDKLMGKAKDRPIEYMEYHHEIAPGESESDAEKERRFRNLEKAAHSQQKAEWDAEKEGIDQMADNFSDDMREQADLVKSLKKERDSLRMEMDAEKKAKEELFNAIGSMDKKAKQLEEELKTAKEEKQRKENEWKARKEDLEAQVRDAQVFMEKFQNLAQQFPRCQALPASLLQKARPGMSDEQEQLNGGKTDNMVTHNPLLAVVGKLVTRSYPEALLFLGTFFCHFHWFCWKLMVLEIDRGAQGRHQSYKSTQ